MKVNGQDVALDGAMTVDALIAARGLDPRRVAIELNGNVVPRAQRATTQLKDSDVVEIVSFVQGG
ncbi:sulfur carrier protein ThiS [Pseudoscardovia radai]|jgi:sulfur carrier protein|uniref:sulfur carrier protein ThiS n=1 Tax=Pseudoscardovia radai TaxID=987066 RepID=UPI002709F1CF|nr:sulfur carrier protein ThiS [Pseudoscardovia radai]